jgi:protein-tyrosine phosphatase
MNLFREVKLPLGVVSEGKLMLHSLPGRYESFTNFMTEMKMSKVNTIVCLVEKNEILRLSPEYARAIIPAEIEIINYPIPDFGTPDPKTFPHIINNIKEQLISGKNILIHCGSGIGRTGLIATSVIISLGSNISQARHSVAVTGARGGGETIEQQKFTEWYASMIIGQKSL